MQGRGRSYTQHGTLLFAIRANLFESGRFDPEACALFAFAHGNSANRYRRHVNFTARTFQHGKRRYRGCGCRRAAMRTMAAADEHHAETGSARYGGQLRSAVLAEQRVGRNRGAAIGTIESLRFHVQPCPQARAVARAIYRSEGRPSMATSHLALADARASDSQVIISRSAITTKKTSSVNKPASRCRSMMMPAKYWTNYPAV